MLQYEETMDTLPLHLAGIGRYLPERVVPSSEVEQLCGLPPGWIEHKTGVRERRWAATETNSYMAAQAAREAVAEAGLALTDIDLILNASGTPGAGHPRRRAADPAAVGAGRAGHRRLSVHATCLSFLAASTCREPPRDRALQNILIVTADIGSVGINFREPESASLIGDAAAAAVVVTRPPAGEAERTAGGALRDLQRGRRPHAIRGGGAAPARPNHPDTRPEDNLFHMEGPAVYRLAHQHLGGFLERLRPGLSSGLGAIRLVVPHQASLWRCGRCACSASRTTRVMNLDRLGNCIATSIPAALYEALRAGRLARGEEVLLLGTGAGLSFGGVILSCQPGGLPRISTDIILSDSR